MLETERATRGARRAFVRYEDLLADWRARGRPRRRAARPAAAARRRPRARSPQVDAFVDPTLHRNRVRWDELDVPGALRDLAEDVWAQLQPLADADGDTPAAAPALDEARAAYGALYAEAEAIAQSSVTAAKPRRSSGAGRGARAAAVAARAARPPGARALPPARCAARSRQLRGARS